MPMNGGKTNEARKRMQWVESRLDVLKKDISRCRLHLKKLGA